MNILKKSNALLVALAMCALAAPAEAQRAKPSKANMARAAAKAKKPARVARTSKPASNRMQQVGRARTAAKKPAAPKPNRTSRWTLRNPGQLLWAYEGNDKQHTRRRDPKTGKMVRVSKDDIRTSYGIDPYATSQTLLETELQATLDLSKYDSAIKAVQAIAKDPKKTKALLGKDGWSLEVKDKKSGTLRMTDFYADSPNFALAKTGSTARWRSVQRLDANGKPMDDKQQLNVKAGMRMLPNHVVVRVEAGTEVPGLVKNGRITDGRLKKFINNHRLEDNPANLIKQLMPKVDAAKLLDSPLVEVTQTRYKFHIKDAAKVDVGEGSIDIVEAKPTKLAKQLFGKQLKGNVRFGRVEYEGEHINPTLSANQLKQAKQSPGPHGAFDVYSNTITRSGDIKTLTGIAGRLTKAVGAKPAQGNKVFEAMTRLGFFDHLPGGANAILKAQKQNEARWMKSIKAANPGFID